MCHVIRDAFEIDESIYQRFSERNIAFNAVSRDLGQDWGPLYAAKRLSLVAEGKASPRESLSQPEDALFHFAFSEGFDRMNVLTANWGSGKSNRGALLWEPPMALPEEVVATRCTDPTKLSREVKRVARVCGAAAVGIAELDARWVYAEVQWNNSSSQLSVTKPIHLVEGGDPRETDKALEIPLELNRVVALAVPMRREMIATAPSLLSEAATSLGYSDAARVSLSVAAYIRAMGYRAIPSLNGTALSIPIAIQVGLGELARNGMLITRDHGPCVRLSKVITDMPLALDAPLHLGVRAYCTTCDECASHCPAQAIPHGVPTYLGQNECNNDGVLKWHVDAKRCLRYWVSSGTSCSACIAHCPFTLGHRWWFGVPQAIIRRTTALNRPIQWFDRRFDSRKRISSSGFLDSR